MNSIDKALETQLKNIQTRTGKTLDELYSIVRKSGLSKHGEIRDMLKKELGMGHGDANMLVHYYLKSENEGEKSSPASLTEVIDEIYSGPKSHLRPIHDKLMEEINTFGSFDIAPKKGYISLRRKKQFAMITPATKSRVEVGLNVKGLDATSRLTELPAGRMCQYKVDVTDGKEVDRELITWIRQAYDAAG
jgi:hypothetical protein